MENRLRCLCNKIYLLTVLSYSNKNTNIRRRVVINIGELRMKTLVNKIFLAVVAIVLVAGTALFTSCEKENSKLSNGTNKGKDGNEFYKSLLEKHDYSFTMEGDGFQKTIFGRLGNDTIGCSEYVNNKLYEYVYISSDENFLGIDKIGGTTAIVHIDGYMSGENKLLFENVKQIEDTVDFYVTCNNTKFAKCRFIMPHESGKFMDLLPIVMNDSKSIDTKDLIASIVSMLDSFFSSDIFSLFKTSEEDVQIANMCYQSMNDHVNKCFEKGGIPVYKHTKKHKRCSFSCNITK